MSSLIGKNEGVFNPTRKFAFTNITTEDFTSAWGGSPITIHPGETVKLDHHLANKMVDEMVDKLMIGGAKLDEVTKNQPFYRSPLGMQLGVPAARKVWEDQIVRELPPEQDSAQMQIERAKIREQLESDLKAEPSTAPVSAPTSLSEFSEIKDIPTPKIAPAPLKVPKIKKAK